MSNHIGDLREDLANLRADLRADIAEVKSMVQAVESKVTLQNSRIGKLEQDKAVQKAVDELKSDQQAEARRFRYWAVGILLTVSSMTLGTGVGIAAIIFK